MIQIMLKISKMALSGSEFDTIFEIFWLFILFICTKQTLIVNTMIDGLNGHDYKLYIITLNIVYCILNGKKNIKIIIQMYY